mgnify:CR=1 FL=1
MSTRKHVPVTRTSPTGVVIQAEFERDNQKVVVSIDLAIDGKKSNRVYDARDGKFIESEQGFQTRADKICNHG